MVDKTSRSFDEDAGVWSAYLVSSPNDVVKCEAWKLFFFEPDYPELAKDANKAAKKENETLRQDLFQAAKDAAQETYNGFPKGGKVAIGHGIGRPVGDKLNTYKPKKDEKADPDGATTKAARAVWTALHSGLSRVASHTSDPFVIAMRNTVQTRLMGAFDMNQSDALKEARDSIAAAIGRLADAKEVDRKEYRVSLEAYVREGLEG